MEYLKSASADTNSEGSTPILHSEKQQSGGSLSSSIAPILIENKDTIKSEMRKLNPAERFLVRQSIRILLPVLGVKPDEMAAVQAYLWGNEVEVTAPNRPRSNGNGSSHDRADDDVDPEDENELLTGSPMPPVLYKQAVDEAVSMFEAGMKYDEIADSINVAYGLDWSYQTAYHVIKRQIAIKRLEAIRSLDHKPAETAPPQPQPEPAPEPQHRGWIRRQIYKLW